MGVFLSVVIFLSKVCPSHTVSPLLFVHAMILQCLFCHAFAYGITAVVHVCLCTASSGACCLKHNSITVKTFGLLQPLFQLSQLHVCGVCITKFKECFQSSEDLEIKTLRSLASCLIISLFFRTPINYHFWKSLVT